ncbi:DNA-binding transcriptional regulator HexR [Streptococcus constellatus]|uniref:DNA-binding transcriptional regulator HexR n=1 Tax=Streptococcus constellatus TaxID=76860 RepID=A0A564SYN6_STRCV|nr:SIS domain-containing protein [Streptococcus constellatus]VUW96094.1 DNA-binding transcriptional regulator HexR [Streptococcus gordonii]VUX00210.1 DNA-binding transcriptional regulator HexR [Streptococcus constellatus]
MLLDQLKEQTDLTHHEKIVAEYILKHLTEFESLSAADLAQEPITGDSRYQDIIETLPKIYDKSLTNTKLSLHKTSINRIANYLQQAERLDLYGIGISYLLAQTAAFKFATLGLEVQAYESLNHHYLAARKDQRTVSLLISFTGRNAQIIEMARYLREKTDSYVVALAGPHHADLLPWCHELVEIPNRDALLSLDVISSFTGANYVLDIFFALLLAKRYDHQAATSLKMLTERSLADKS